jgi:hypothetical protein
VFIKDGGAQATAELFPVPRTDPRPPASAAIHTRLRRPAESWTRRYNLGLLVLEVASAVAVGIVFPLLSADDDTPIRMVPWAPLALAIGWVLLLSMAGAHEESLFGTGSEEYRRVSRAGVVLLAAVAFLSYAAALHLSRELVVEAIPALVAVTLAGRWAARSALHRARALGRCTKRVVVVGRGGAVLDLTEQLRRSPAIGLEVVAACVTAEGRGRVTEEAGVPVGELDDVLDVAARYQASAIAVTSASETAAQWLRRLSWQLEGSGLELLVAPGLVEVAGPRLHIRPFEGLPLLSVEQPRFTGVARVVKGGLDRFVAAGALLLSAPVLLAIALAILVTDPGPVFFRQERVGVKGRAFTMLKFRTMVVDAEQRLEELRAANLSDGLLFKMRRDPRVTPVGRWLRRLSLDELPQLVNVLGGSM